MNEIFAADYFRDLVTLMRSGGDVNAFVSGIEAAERADFMQNDKTLNNCDTMIRAYSADVQKTQTEIEALDKKKAVLADLREIIRTCPEDRRRMLGFFLSDYVNNWRTDTRWYSQLTVRPAGLFNLIKNGGAVRAWCDTLTAFLDRCRDGGLNGVLGEIVRYASGLSDSGLDSMAYTLDMSRGTMMAMHKQARHMLQHEQDVKHKHIARYDSDDVQFSQYAYARKSRRDKINQLAKYLRNPDLSKEPDYYVESMDSINDADPVLFNVGVTMAALFNDSVAGQKILDNILWLRGQKSGSGTDGWHIRASRRDDNSLELFSPVMDGASAKEIMPLVLSDLELLDMRIGLCLPINGRDLPVHKTEPDKHIDNSEFAKLVRVAELQRRIEDYKQSGAFASVEEIANKRAKELGYNSVEELMRVPIYKSEEELMARYPADKYLFCGTAVSDDYFSFSRRTRRSGLIYASPTTRYAASYSCARFAGQSPTKDMYVETDAGKTSDGFDIHVGFVNVYEQSPKDKFYADFGIEDSKPGVGGARLLERKQALVQGNAETFVTRDKNPLAEKVVHVVVFEDGRFRQKEYYIPVSALTEETRTGLMYNRRADISKTYLGEPEMVSRLYAQRDEFDKGIVHKLSQTSARPGATKPMSPTVLAAMNDLSHQPV